MKIHTVTIPLKDAMESGYKPKRGDKIFLNYGSPRAFRFEKIVKKGFVKLELMGMPEHMAYCFVQCRVAMIDEVLSHLNAVEYDNEVPQDYFLEMRDVIYDLENPDAK